MRELGDETLKKVAHELAESLRKNASVDRAVRDSVRQAPPDGDAHLAQEPVSAD